MAGKPTARIIDAPNNKTVTDSLGRVITVRKLSALDRMRLSSMLGADDAQNMGVLQFAIVAYSVTQIDNAPIVTPTSRLALEGIVGRLDDAGFNAAMPAWAELNKTPSDEEVTDTAKNS